LNNNESRLLYGFAKCIILMGGCEPSE